MASPTPLSKANTTFALALLKKLSDNDKTANVFYSPFSISSALAMVMMGARGNTATQMSEVQHAHTVTLMAMQGGTPNSVSFREARNIFFLFKMVLRLYTWCAKWCRFHNANVSGTIQSNTEEFKIHRIEGQKGVLQALCSLWITRSFCQYQHERHSLSCSDCD